MLAYVLGSSAKPGCISREEFIAGMKKAGKSSIEGLKDILPALDPGFLDRTEFREFYKFAFKFSLEGTKRTLEKELVLDLLPIVLDENRAPHMNSFLAFLQECEHKVITLDQWTSFLLFSQTTAKDLSDFDEDGAWPLLLDEFVDWRKAQIKTETEK